MVLSKDVGHGVSDGGEKSLVTAIDCIYPSSLLGRTALMHLVVSSGFYFDVLAYCVLL